MTARPQAPQVTSQAHACAQRDTEGLCQGEWPQRVVTCRVRRRSGPGWAGGHWPRPPAAASLPLLPLLPGAESHGPHPILAGLHLISSRQQWWLYSHTQQSLTEGHQPSPSHYTRCSSSTSDYTACSPRLEPGAPEPLQGATPLTAIPLPASGHGAGPAGQGRREAPRLEEGPSTPG